MPRPIRWPWTTSIVAAQVLENKLRGPDARALGAEVKHRVDHGADCFIIDTRGPVEFEESRLGIGETLIPLGALRDRLGELPQDKDREIILYCQISLRGYEAAAILQGPWLAQRQGDGGRRLGLALSAGEIIPAGRVSAASPDGLLSRPGGLRRVRSRPRPWPHGHSAAAP